MTTATNSRLGAALVLLFAGCVGPVEIAPLPYSHPANPEAPAGQTPLAGSLLTAPDAESEPRSDVEMPQHRSKAEAARLGKYQCPMHPEVRSEKPERCSICGMRLVNKGGASEHKGDHER